MSKSLLHPLLILMLVLTVITVKSQQLDASFHAPVALRPSHIASMVTQQDGKILIGGEAAYHGNKLVNNLLRIAPNGTLDGTFVSKVPFGYIVDKILLTPSDEIALSLTHVSNSGYTSAVAILDNTGNLIAQSGTLPYRLALAVLPDGKLLIGGHLSMGGLKRMNADLSIDPTFNVPVDGAITDIQLQGDKIFVSGTFSSVNGVTKNDIVKLNLDGTIDDTFDTGAGTPDRIGAITILSDGKVLPGMTYINEFDGTRRWGSVRLNSDGSLDESFAVSVNFRGPISRVKVIDDKLYITGFSSWAGVSANHLLRFTEEGSRDESFAPVAFKEGLSYDVHTIASGNEVIISGPSKVGNDYGLIKADHEGSISPDFHPRIGRYGKLRFGERVGDRLLVAGDFIRIDSVNTFGIARLHLNGTVDNTFAIEENYGAVEQLRVLTDGNILVSTFLNFFKVDSDGKKVESFHWDKRPPLYQVIRFNLMKDGSIIVLDYNTLAKLNPDGSYDESFKVGPNGASSISDFDLQGDDIIYGSPGRVDEQTYKVFPVVRRVKPDGTYDPNFSIDGPEPSPEVAPEMDFLAIALVQVLDNGEILVGGSFRQYAGAKVAHSLVKLSADGELDENFNSNQLEADGPKFFFNAAVKQMGEKIYIKTDASIYSINLDGTVNEFDLPMDVENISSIVAVPSDPGNPSGRSDSSEDQLIAIGTFYDATSKSHGSMVRLKITRPSQPTEPNEPTEPEVITSINKKIESLEVEIFPNPATDHLHVKVSDGSAGMCIDIYGPAGSRIADQRSSIGSDDVNTVDVSSIPPGVYTIKVITAMGKIAVSKFVRLP